MQFHQIDTKSWGEFISLTKKEEWRVAQSERELFSGMWQQYAWYLDDSSGVGQDHVCGYVTAVPYKKSGWIGNLIVPEALRGLGYGSALFDYAVTMLESKGIETIWLAASKEGAPLYQSRGFRQVDTVVRYVLPMGGSSQCQSERRDGDVADVAGADTNSLLKYDSEIWQDDRFSYLNPLVSTGVLIAAGKSIALLQRAEEGMQVIGPWYSTDGENQENNRNILLEIISNIAPNSELVVDVLDSSPIQSTLMECGFTPIGQTSLMVLGDSRSVELSKIVSLASLGSVG